MGIWERLGTVVKSYLSNESPDTHWRDSGKKRGSGGQSDPDLDAAFEELEEFLRGENAKNGKADTPKAAEEAPPAPVPKNIREAFSELGLAPEASAEDCKAAYKKLLKVHHPDRHARHPGNLKKATEKTTRVNDAYTRLEKWFEKAKG